MPGRSWACRAGPEARGQLVLCGHTSYELTSAVSAGWGL